TMVFLRDGIWQATATIGDGSPPFVLYFCGICTYKTRRKGNALFQHALTVFYVDRGIYQGWCRESNSPLFFCSYCPYKTNRKGSAISQHYKVHSPHLPFECPYCKRRFRWKQSFRNHIANVHYDQRPAFVQESRIMSHKYKLKWNCHHTETFQAFDQLRIREMFVDVTLSCEDQFLRAHKLVLSAGSKYLERILQRDGTSCPTVHFYGVEMFILKLLVEFMYNGEVEVPSVHLEKFIELAENLEVRGLRGKEQSKDSVKTPDATDYGSSASWKRRSISHSVEDSPYPIKQPKQAYDMHCSAPSAVSIQPETVRHASSRSRLSSLELDSSTNNDCDEVVAMKEESTEGALVGTVTENPSDIERYWLPDQTVSGIKRQLHMQYLQVRPEVSRDLLEAL
ncbi:unnamed protein product, partial [Darwinula stevensoni]